MYKLYGRVHSRASRVIWLLEELGQPYDLIPAGPHDPQVLALHRAHASLQVCRRCFYAMVRTWMLHKILSAKGSRVLRDRPRYCSELTGYRVCSVRAMISSCILSLSVQK